MTTHNPVSLFWGYRRYVQTNMIMEQKLEQYLDEIVQMLREAGAFALEELPEFVQELLHFYFWYHSLWTMVFFILCLGSFFLVYMTRVWKEEAKWSIDRDKWNLWGMLFALAGSFFLMFFSYHGIQMLKITIAPRVYLIQSLSKFLTGC